MEQALFVRHIGTLGLALLATSCVAWAQSIPEDEAEGLSPELAALVAQPQTGSFNPEATKDAEFFRPTPERFRPFVAICNPWDEWDKPAPPFQIHGNTYYVGTCGIAAVLIVGKERHFLIDSGTEAGAEVVMDNIRTLGFDLEDIELLLTSHEHHDHVGGMAKLQAATGATVLTSDAAKQVLLTGEAHEDDPQYGLHEGMEPVLRVDTYGLGNHYGYILDYLGVRFIETPGHSPGALTWQWESCDGETCLTVVYADSLSPVSRDDYKFSDHPEYLANYRAGLERLSRLDCDILLTPHPSHSRMVRRLRTNALVQPTACAYYAIDKNRDLEARLEREAGGNQ